MAFIRKIKKKSGTYLERVESYREDGKVKHRFLGYLGREVNGKPIRRVKISDIGVESVKRYGDVLCADKIAQDLGLHELFEKNVLMLAYSHLLDEVSINDMKGWVKQTEIPDILDLEKVSTKRIYHALDDLDKLDFTPMEESLYRKFSEHEEDQTAVVVDITDTYFEGRKGSSSKKRRGKDGKYRNLLQICLAATLKHGFPVMHRTYGGNVSDVRIFRDMTAELKSRGFNSIIVDRGVHSTGNIERMHELKMKCVMGIKKIQSLKKEFLDPLPREDIYCRDTRVVLKNTTVHARSFDYLDGNLIVVYNPSLEVQRREKHYATGGSDEDARYIGYSLIYHNTNMSTGEAVKQYFEKDVIERAFKQMKGVLSIRPIRMWLKNHVNGHIRVCYLSYAILSMLAYRLTDLEISPQEALKKLKTSYNVHLKDNESSFTWSSMVNLEKIQDEILERVGVVRKM